MSLAKNEISEIPSAALSRIRLKDSDHQSLIKLDLSNNNIEKVNNESFSFSNQLQTLDLSENQCELSKYSFLELKDLSSLDLSGLNLSDIPDGLFNPLTNLQELKLDHNKLEWISENTFTNLRQLQILSISWNDNLREFDSKAFEQNNYLSKIEITHNKVLSTLPKELFSNLPNLSYLDLSHNNLSHLELPPNQTWDNLLLSDNPWTCEGNSLSHAILSECANNPTDKLSIGEIIGIAIAVVAVVLILAGLCVWHLTKKIKGKEHPDEEENIGLTTNEEKEKEVEKPELLMNERETETKKVKLDQEEKEKEIQLKKPFEDIKNNGRKKVLIIGKTGTGKSTLCNVLSGLPHNANVFQVSAGALACTQETQLADVFFNGQKDKPISIIDTIGFDDPKNDVDAVVIADLVTKLQNRPCNKDLLRFWRNPL